MIYKVYISSTHEDLREYRDAVRDAVIRLGMLPVMEDDFGLAINEESLAYLKRQMHDSDVFIGIYAHQYGRAVGPEGKSLEEQEFDWALEIGLHRLLFVVNPEARWPLQFVERGPRAEALARFKERLAREATISLFSSMHELQTMTFLGLHQAVEMLHHRDGMISSRAVFGPPLEGAQYRADVFMIMPFREKFEPVYRQAVIPAVESLSLSIKRGDDYFSTHAIIQEIWAAIYNARIVVAELSDRNTNVFYELGIAHAIGKPGVMIVQNIEDIPFDLRHLRFIVYEDSPEGLKNLHEQLRAAIPALLQESSSH